MHRYLSLTGLMAAFFLLLFLLVEALGVPLLTDPTPVLAQGGWWAAGLGVGLLIADVLLPVPSSLVMIAHGAMFGVVLGTVLSVLGSCGAALVGFAIGRRGGRLLQRVVTREEGARADHWLSRWGALAIIVTRPAPLLAETVAILAGASSLGWRSLILASLAGSLPPALLYALTGATVIGLPRTTLIFGGVLLLAGFFWFVGQRAEPLLARRRNGSV